MVKEFITELDSYVKPKKLDGLAPLAPFQHYLSKPTKNFNKYRL